MSGGFVVPDPPWLVCKGDESRTFRISRCADGRYEMQIFNQDEVLEASRCFETRELAIEWGVDARSTLSFDGWKHPRDAAVDRDQEEGVRNWNLLVVGQRGEKFSQWTTMMLLPAAKRAMQDYAGAPYLGMLADEELFARYRTLAVSTMEVMADGHVQPAPWDRGHDKWIHAATELLLRDLSLDDERSRPDWGFLQTNVVRRAVDAYSKRRLDWGDDIFVKFGSARFLRPALERGAFRISPASSYDEPSMNLARRDMELERRLVDTATDFGAAIRQRAEDMTPEERALYTRSVESRSDYYIFCLAHGWQVRLFDDFDADACLVITNPERFAAALRVAAADLLPEWHFSCQTVRYIDPVQNLRFVTPRVQARFAPFFCKDFSYSYQREVRAAWLPPEPNLLRAELDHIFVELGNLTEYCELIEL